MMNCNSYWKYRTASPSVFNIELLSIKQSRIKLDIDPFGYNAYRLFNCAARCQKANELAASIPNTGNGIHQLW
jgi:hypothetical protein